MTELGAVRVTVAKACPAGCARGKIVTRSRWEGGEVTGSGDCVICHGRGVVDEPVSCAGCKHFGQFNETAGWCGFWMSSTIGAVPCAKWEPREP